MAKKNENCSFSQLFFVFRDNIDFDWGQIFSIDFVVFLLLFSLIFIVSNNRLNVV